MPPDLETRLLAQRNVLPNGCWEWQGTRQPNGYGQLKVQRIKKMVHRAAWELWVGTIPAGLQMDHLCRNRACFNPTHLEPVTPKVNVLRGVSISAENARKTHCLNGHEFTPANTMHVGPDRLGRSCRACMQERERRRGPRDRTGRVHRRRRSAADA